MYRLTEEQERIVAEATSRSHFWAPVSRATTDQAYDFIGRALCGLELF